MTDNSTNRKTDHLALTFEAQTGKDTVDGRFLYEPLLGNPAEAVLTTRFLDRKFNAPLWISSMTGGTGKAKQININLAKACKKYGLGMGLGSCRQLLDSDAHFEDFNVRKYIGDRPLYANLGIAQVEQLVKAGKTGKIKDLIDRLQADGLIIHINPLQEFFQPGGDNIHHRAIDIIKSLLESLDIDIIVKEVGQGMGINSLLALMRLPLRAIEFGAYGGTNFSKLEMMRNKNKNIEWLAPLFRVGHTAAEMVDFVNLLIAQGHDGILCDSFIISGGIKNFLDGYYLTEKINSTAVYGMASAFLKPAMNGFEDLDMFLASQIEGLKMAKAFLKIKN